MDPTHHIPSPPIERLPFEVLFYCLGMLDNQTLKSTFLVNRRLFSFKSALQAIYEKEVLKMLLRSNLSLDSIDPHWKKIKAIRERQKLKLPQKKEYIFSYLVLKDFGKRKIWEFPLELTSLFVECTSLVELPTGIRPTRLLLKCSIEMHNFSLCRSILSSLESSERINWQKEMVPGLINKGNSLQSHVNLVLEWEEDIFNDTKTSKMADSIAYISLCYRSEVITEALIKRRYKPNNLPSDWKEVTALLFLLSRIDFKIHKRSIWSKLLHFILLGLNKEQREQLLDNSETLLSKNWKKIKPSLDNSLGVYNGDNILLKSTHEKEKVSVSLMHYFLSDFDEVIDLDKSSFEVKPKIDQEALWLQLFADEWVSAVKGKVSQKKDAVWLTKEIQFFSSILEGNTEHIKKTVIAYGIAPSVLSLEWMLIELNRLKLGYSDSLSVDKGFCSVFKIFPDLLKEINFSHVIAFAALNLTSTLGYITPFLKIENLSSYIRHELKKRSSLSQEAFREKCVKCALAGKQFWILSYLLGDIAFKKCIQNEFIANEWSNLKPLEIIKHLKEYDAINLLTDVYWKRLFEEYLQNSQIKKQDKINVLQFLLDEKLLDIAKILGFAKQLTNEHWLYQFIIFDQWILQNTPFSELNRKEYNYFVKNRVDAISVQDTGEANELIVFLYGLFYFQQYPGLLSVMNEEKREEMFVHLFSKVTMWIEKQLLAEKEKRIAQYRQDNEMQKSVLADYKNKGHVRVYIGTYSVSCAFLTAKYFLEVFGSILTAQQIFSKCLAFDEIHPLHQVCIQYLKLLKKIRDEWASLDTQTANKLKERIYLLDSLIEKRQACEKEQLYSFR